MDIQTRFGTPFIVLFPTDITKCEWKIHNIHSPKSRKKLSWANREDLVISYCSSHSSFLYETRVSTLWICITEEKPTHQCQNYRFSFFYKKAYQNWYFRLALVSKECNFTIWGLSISFGSLSTQVNGTATSLSVYANTSNTPKRTNKFNQKNVTKSQKLLIVLNGWSGSYMFHQGMASK